MMGDSKKLSFQCVVPDCSAEVEEMTIYSGYNPVCCEHKDYHEDQVRCAIAGCPGKVQELRSDGNVHVPLCDQHADDGEWVKYRFMVLEYPEWNLIRPVIFG